MWVVIGYYGYEIVCYLEIVVDLVDFEFYCQVGNLGVFFEVIWVVVQGVDVGFQMDIGFCGFVYYVFWFYFDWLQIDCCNFYVVVLLWYVDWVFEC